MIDKMQRLMERHRRACFRNMDLGSLTILQRYKIQYTLCAVLCAIAHCTKSWGPKHSPNNLSRVIYLRQSSKGTISMIKHNWSHATGQTPPLFLGPQ